jgi:hypothetical protein
MVSSVSPSAVKAYSTRALNSAIFSFSESIKMTISIRMKKRNKTKEERTQRVHTKREGQINLAKGNKVFFLAR